MNTPRVVGAGVGAGVGSSASSDHDGETKRGRRSTAKKREEGNALGLAACDELRKQTLESPQQHFPFPQPPWSRCTKTTLPAGQLTPSGGRLTSQYSVPRKADTLGSDQSGYQIQASSVPGGAKISMSRCAAQNSRSQHALGPQIGKLPRVVYPSVL